MPITKQVPKEAPLEKAGWDMAIADAKEKIRNLHESIRVFRARKNAGDPWPSGQSKLARRHTAQG
ncbi:MAG TPA: hypothetical protein VFQ43_08505 [Nitrososphaera sp.]|nr:hypothetical protein [Nitrososphaera sp.]